MGDFDRESQTTNPPALEIRAHQGEMLTIEPIPGVTKYAYHIYIPKVLRDNPLLLMWGNGTEHGDYASIKPRSRKDFTAITQTCDQHNYIGFMPILPDTYTDKTHLIETQMLSYGSLIHPEQPFRYRPDLDIIAFTEYAAAFAQTQQVTLREKLIVGGVSAGACLANRFAILHPERVQACILMIGGDFCYPEPDNGKRPDLYMPYPFGIAEIEGELWTSEKRNIFLQIPHYIYYGEKDTQLSHDPSNHIDSAYITPSAMRIIREKLGRTQRERAIHYISYLREQGCSVWEFHQDLGHQTSTEAFDRVSQFCNNL